MLVATSYQAVSRFATLRYTARDSGNVNGPGVAFTPGATSRNSISLDQLVNDSTPGFTPDPVLETDEQLDQIIATALAAFAEHGYANTTLDHIAMRAGITTPVLLTFYPNKEDVFREVVRSTLIGSLSARLQK